MTNPETDENAEPIALIPAFATVERTDFKNEFILVFFVAFSVERRQSRKRFSPPPSWGRNKVGVMTN